MLVFSILQISFLDDIVITRYCHTEMKPCGSRMWVLRAKAGWKRIWIRDICSSSQQPAARGFLQTTCRTSRTEHPEIYVYSLTARTSTAAPCHAAEYATLNCTWLWHLSLNNTSLHFCKDLLAWQPWCQHCRWPGQVGGPTRHGLPKRALHHSPCTMASHSWSAPYIPGCIGPHKLNI